MNEKWLKTRYGFCIEMSDFPPYTVNGNIPLPDGSQVSFKKFTLHRDNEGDITHWDYTDKGVKYTIFND